MPQLSQEGWGAVVSKNYRYSWITYRPRKNVLIDDLRQADKQEKLPVAVGLSEMLDAEGFGDSAVLCDHKANINGLYGLDARCSVCNDYLISDQDVPGMKRAIGHGTSFKGLISDPILEAQGANPPPGAFSPDRSEADLCLDSPRTALEKAVTVLKQKMIADGRHLLHSVPRYYDRITRIDLGPSVLISDLDLCVHDRFAEECQEKYAQFAEECLKKYAAHDLELTQRILSAFQLRPEDLVRTDGMKVFARDKPGSEHAKE